jgi:hypothetical protein
VRVQVDQAGHDVAVVAADLDHAGGLARRNVLLDRADPAAADGDIEPAVEPLARIEDMAA